jgi:Ca2+-binding EF-hand superfamily protein
VEKAWKLFDKNGDGKLTKTEFRWMTDKKILTDRQIDLMFSKCDSNGDGVLDFDEFKDMIFRNR